MTLQNGVLAEQHLSRLAANRGPHLRMTAGDRPLDKFANLGFNSFIQIRQLTHGPAAPPASSLRRQGPTRRVVYVVRGAHYRATMQGSELRRGNSRPQSFTLWNMGPCLRRDDGGGAAGRHRQIQRLSAAPEQASQQCLRKQMQRFRKESGKPLSH